MQQSYASIFLGNYFGTPGRHTCFFMSSFIFYSSMIFMLHCVNRAVGIIVRLYHNMMCIEMEMEMEVIRCLFSTRTGIDVSL